MKKLHEVIGLIEKFAPPNLAFFDYVGLLQGLPSQEVKKIGITLDYSLQAIDKAVSQNCDLLITHHGPEKKENRHYGNDLKKYKAAQKNSLAVYRCHLSLDFCSSGIIEELCKLLGIPASPVGITYNNIKLNGAVRLAENYPMTLNDLVKRTKVLNYPYLRLAGPIKEKFSRIAITSGQGFISEFFDQLLPDIYIAGEFEQEATKYAEDLGIMLVEISHHASESKPLENVAKTLEKYLGVEVVHVEVPDTIRVIHTVH